MRDSFINNRKALFALLVCAGFIAGHPLTAMAEPAAAVSQQQTNEVSGIVRDATGEAVIGASVVEKGTNNGIITDLDGKFTLKVKSGAVLEISFIGYKTQTVEAVPGKTLQIPLQEDSEPLEKWW